MANRPLPPTAPCSPPEHRISHKAARIPAQILGVAEDEPTVQWLVVSETMRNFVGAQCDDYPGQPTAVGETRKADQFALARIPLRSFPQMSCKDGVLLPIVRLTNCQLLKRQILREIGYLELVWNSNHHKCEKLTAIYFDI